MGKNILVINVDIRETRVALIEGGIIAELQMERASEDRCLGNVVIGRVTRVLPGMQAAFIDVGLDKAAFLHVEDLIRPDDLESYLSGKKRDRGDDDSPTVEEADAAPAPQAKREGREGRESRRDERRGRGERGERGERDVSRRAAPVPAAKVDAPVAEIAASEPVAAPSEPPAIPEPVPSELVDEVVAEADAEAPDADETAVAEPVEGASVEADAVEADAVVGASDVDEIEAESAGDEAEDAADDEGGEPAEGAEAPATDAAPGAAPAPARTGRRRRRRRGGGAGREPAAAKEPEPPPQQQRKQARRGENASRIDKNTPIRDVVREGQEVLVQISKEPIGTKGARVTSHVSLPGRYVVFLPTVEYVGVSKRIGSEKERQRLRETIDGMRPPTGGIIIRTLAEGLTKKQLKADVGYLVRLWGDIAKKREGARAPAVLYEELDVVLKVARDMFGDDVEKIVIDDRAQYERLVRFVEMFMPERVKDVELYTGDEPIFDAYGLEEEIKRALSRKVPLPSGGYLIIDEAEALTAIDVNTGRFVGKGSKDHEETILKTNLEAVEEIAYQLRFRNLGGLIVLDLIDMERASSREQVRRRLEDLLQKDKAKTSLNRISELGLIEMTRKRTRESLGRALHEPCSYCDGTGQVMSKQTIVYEILRAIRRDVSGLPGYTILVNAHPDVCALMKTDEREALREAEKRYMRRIDLVPQKGYHVEQFDLVGKLPTLRRYDDSPRLAGVTHERPSGATG